MRTSVVCLLAILAVIAGSLDVSAQTRSENIRPRWINNPPEPTNSSFRYETVTARASSLDAAREKCLAELIAGAGFRNGMVTVSNNNSTEELHQVWNNGRLTETYETNSRTSTSAKGSETKLYVDNVAEYWERDKAGEYYVTRLFAKSELDRPPLFDNVELTSRYGARGLWRSMIIPGWGQFYKGSTVKGALILGGTAVLVGGIIFTENERASYVKKLRSTHNQSMIKSYRTKRDNYTTARNVCIGAAAALYVYNIIDAIVAPGATRAVVRNYGRDGGVYSFMPSVTAEGAPGVTAVITF